MADNRSKKPIDKKGLAVFLATLPFAFPYYVGLTVASLLQIYSERIDSEGQLQKVIGKEVNKLGMKEKVVGVLYPYNQARASVEGLNIADRKNPQFVPVEEVDGKEVIKIGIVELGGINSTKSMARHEAYHIARGHVDKDTKTYGNKLRYLFIEEPLTILYALTGIDVPSLIPPLTKPNKRKIKNGQ